MPGSDPGIHPNKNPSASAMDCRVEPGNDGGRLGKHPASAAPAPNNILVIGRRP